MNIINRQFERSREHIKNTLFVICLLNSISIFANADLEKKAETAFSEKKYKEAITIYETILKDRYISYKLYYNLGNSYYKNNELGKAIYNYELANKLQPNNSDVLTNLKIANSKTIDQIESKENFFIIAIRSGLVTVLSTDGWAWLSIISLCVALSFAFLFFSSSNSLFKRIGFFASGTCFILFISSFALGYTALNDKQKIKFAIITANEVRMHEEPSIESKSKFNLHAGTKVNILESNTNWTNIKLDNGNEGWLKTSDVGLF